MVTTVRSLGLTGISGYEVTVECMLSGGLPAFDVVGLPDTAVKEARAARAAQVAEELHRAYLNGCVGQVYPVLFEQVKDGLSTGHAPNYMEVAMEGDNLHNVVQNVKITGVENDILRGEFT